jgi:hypothetical protein
MLETIAVEFRPMALSLPLMPSCEVGLDVSRTRVPVTWAKSTTSTPLSAEADIHQSAFPLASTGFEMSEATDPFLHQTAVSHERGLVEAVGGIDVLPGKHCQSCDHLIIDGERVAATVRVVGGFAASWEVHRASLVTQAEAACPTSLMGNHPLRN